MVHSVKANHTPVRLSCHSPNLYRSELFCQVGPVLLSCVVSRAWMEEIRAGAAHSTAAARGLKCVHVTRLVAQWHTFSRTLLSANFKNPRARGRLTIGKCSRSLRVWNREELYESLHQVYVCAFVVVWLRDVFSRFWAQGMSDAVNAKQLISLIRRDIRINTKK